MSVATIDKPRRARQSAGLFDELIVDEFAGGGGVSMGIELALGRAPDLAVNHNRHAIAMHHANHPHTRHICQDVWQVDPREVTGGRAVGLAWFSPDCRHFSRAKGGKPVEKKIRGLAWVALRWARRARPRVIILENVREFQGWGPLDADGRPIIERTGETFKRFVRELRCVGYAVEWRELNAADFGAPTHRRRLFLIARCDGRPICWPAPTHGPGRSKAWRTAAECIDWSLPCPSIFERKRELAEKTMRRIAMGLRRFVFEDPKPFIVQVNHGGDEFRGQTPDRPLPTISAKHGYGVVMPHVQQFFGGMVGKRVDELLPTVTAIDHNAIVAAHIVGVGGRSGQSPPTASNAPVGTVTAKNDRAIVTAHLAHYHGEKGQEVRGSRPDCPQPTQTTENRFALVTSFLSKYYGTNVGQRLDQPMPTITGGGNHIAEVRAFLVKYYGTAVGQSCREPMHTVTSKHRLGLVTIEGSDWQIVDIGLRMLSPRELARAQSFPDEYVLIGSKATQVAMIGNSVPPLLAKAVVKANCGDELDEVAA